MSNIQTVKKRIKKLAKNFGLNHNPKIFGVNFVSKKDMLMLRYISTCPDPTLLKYGKTVKARINNMDRFLKTKDFKKEVKKAGGSVFTLKELKKNFRDVKNKDIKSILKKLKNKTYGDQFIVLSKPTKEEIKFCFDTILFHEWIHVLLKYNGIYFQSINKKLWTLDEGLTCYLENSKVGKNQDISQLFKRRLKDCSKMYKIYATNALKFNKLLKDKQTPKQRKKALMAHYNKLK